MRRALRVVDMLRDFVDQGGALRVPDAAGALPRLVEALAPAPCDPVVEKTACSGFHASRLDAVLRERAVDTVRLAGCVTNICVLYTAADAAMRGYDVEVVEDAVAGLDPGDHAFALRQMTKVLGARLARREG